MSHEQLEFLKYVPVNGSTIGNLTLREKLKWDQEKYWKIRNELLDIGTIRKSTGKGGAVSLVEISSKEMLKENKSEKKQQYPKERDLYKPFKKTIDEIGKDAMRFDRFICEDTSSQGRRNTKGLWTRPDIVIVSVSKYPFIPGQVFDIISFEIKLLSNSAITGVFETASHSRFATKSYLSIYLPLDWDDDDEDLSRIRGECERFKVGLILFTDPADFDTWDFKIEPDRQNPDPSDMNEFITQQLGEDSKKEISLMKF